MKPTNLLLTLLIFALAFGAFFYFTRPPQAGLAAQLVGDSPALDGFARATGPQPLPFPESLGAHPDYQTEWWYYTGNLQTTDGRRFGYQLTFFRRALLPAEQRQERASDWAVEQIYFAHFALSDIANQQFYAAERFERGAAGLAGAQAEPYQVWLKNWQAQAQPDGSIQLFAQTPEITLDLTLIDSKGPVLQGQQGYSQKGTDPGNASYYYSQTRLISTGTLSIGGEIFDITGLSWKDHEFSTSALSPGQIGWDWFSIQLDDDYELMLFHLRREDGSIDPFSSGTLIAPDGSTQPLALDDFEIMVLDTWRSPHSGAEYPAGWQINIPSADLQLQVAPHMADQELLLSFVYWEGAVQVRGTHNSQPVQGNGYVELTGYYASMEGEF